MFKWSSFSSSQVYILFFFQISKSVYLVNKLSATLLTLSIVKFHNNYTFENEKRKHFIFQFALQLQYLYNNPEYFTS